MQVFAVDFCAILLVCKTRIIAHPHSPPPKKNPFYLLRFFHINKEISRHFPVQWRIQRMREESQISQPTFLSRVCRISSSALWPPRSWACRWAWRWARRSPSPSGRVRPTLWSRSWPWFVRVSGSPDPGTGGCFSTGAGRGQRAACPSCAPSFQGANQSGALRASERESGGTSAELQPLWDRTRQHHMSSQFTATNRRAQQKYNYYILKPIWNILGLFLQYRFIRVIVF